MKDLDSLLEQENEMDKTVDITTDTESVDANSTEEIDSIREIKKFVDENSSVDFRGANNLAQSNIIIRETIPANSKFGVESFAKLSELISNKTGVKVTQRQAAASWYYILYQLFYNK